MRVDDFDFELPAHCIAQRPVAPRDEARLLEVSDRLADHRVCDLPRLLRPGDVLVVNDTRVLPVRLIGRRGDGRVELTLLREVAPGRWRALARPARRLGPGDRIEFAGGVAARVEARHRQGKIGLRFSESGPAMTDWLNRHGGMPLPPYIRRPDGPDARDRDDYQTPFASRDGAVAAPTAGLHFTRRLLWALDRRGVERVAVTLHVGPGTFLPVTAAETEAHRMQPETGLIEAEAARRLNAARAAGRRLVAVGSTALRLLESAADGRGRVQPFAGQTDLFITPGYRFRVADLLITNFHLPRSTLFMLVSAFSGLARMHTAYRHARRNGYRFYSYGDCCLLHRRAGR
ncbi:MAG: tRNA preQ1(34) S-adenosylmethionine ribosyltransferase-isomerase QueA [Kiloniellales bacterium]